MPPPWGQHFPTSQGSASLSKGSSFGSSFLLVSILYTAGLGTPAVPQLRRPQKRGKSHCRAAPGDSPSLCPLSSHGEQSPPRTAESLDNCPAINLPLCLTRGIKMSLLFIYFLSFFSALTVARGRNPQASTRALLEPRDFGDAALPIALWGTGATSCCQLPAPWLLGSREEEKGLGTTRKTGTRCRLRLEIQNWPALRAARFGFSPPFGATKTTKKLTLGRLCGTARARAAGGDPACFM